MPRFLIDSLGWGECAAYVWMQGKRLGPLTQGQRRICVYFWCVFRLWQNFLCVFAWFLPPFLSVFRASMLLRPPAAWGSWEPDGSSLRHADVPDRRHRGGEQWRRSHLPCARAQRPRLGLNLPFVQQVWPQGLPPAHSVRRHRGFLAAAGVSRGAFDRSLPGTLGFVPRLQWSWLRGACGTANFCIVHHGF